MPVTPRARMQVVCCFFPSGKLAFGVRRRRRLPTQPFCEVGLAVTSSRCFSPRRCDYLALAPPHPRLPSVWNAPKTLFPEKVFHTLSLSWSRRKSRLFLPSAKLLCALPHPWPACSIGVRVGISMWLLRNEYLATERCLSRRHIPHDTMRVDLGDQGKRPQQKRWVRLCSRPCGWTRKA